MLTNIVLHAQPGDVICVVGPLGSGKASWNLSPDDYDDRLFLRVLLCKHCLVKSLTSTGKCAYMARSVMSLKKLVTSRCMLWSYDERTIRLNSGSSCRPSRTIFPSAKNAVTNCFNVWSMRLHSTRSVHKKIEFLAIENDRLRLPCVIPWYWQPCWWSRSDAIWSEKHSSDPKNWRSTAMIT
jgi:hypothetical protein